MDLTEAKDTKRLHTEGEWQGRAGEGDRKGNEEVEGGGGGKERG